MPFHSPFSPPVTPWEAFGHASISDALGAL